MIFSPCNPNSVLRSELPLRAIRRRQCRPDPLASTEAVRALIRQLGDGRPELIPRKDRDLLRMLRAVRRVRRDPATETKRGRPGSCKRVELLRVGARLSDLLERETSAHISASRVLLNTICVYSNSLLM